MPPVLITKKIKNNGNTTKNEIFNNIKDNINKFCSKIDVSHSKITVNYDNETIHGYGPTIRKICNKKRINFIKEHTNLNIIRGEKKNKGFKSLPNRPYSIQEVSANRSLKEILLLCFYSRENIELEIELKNGDILKIILLF